MAEPVITFLPYQKAWIADQSRFKIGMFTRRGGKTFGAGGEIVDDCINAEIEGHKTRWTILSRSEATAKEAIEDAVKPMTEGFYAAYSTLARKGRPEFSEEDFHVPAHKREVVQNGETHLIDVEEAKYKAQEVRYPGGSARHDRCPAHGRHCTDQASTTHHAATSERSPGRGTRLERLH